MQGRCREGIEVTMAHQPPQQIATPATAVKTVDSAASVSVPHAASRFYRPELDVVRFIAFLLVFLHHAMPVPPDLATAARAGRLAYLHYTCRWAAGLGLSLFFTLSAYLICELLRRERDATGTVRVREFYMRRILRIWPLYFAGLGIGLVIALVHGGAQDVVEWTGWAAVLLGNWYIVLHGFPITPMAPLWSISVEEQFYLIAPCAVKFLNRWALAALSIALILVANGWVFYLGRQAVPQSALWANSFIQFQDFAAGILLCLLLRSRSPKFSVWQRVALVAAWAICWSYAVSGLDMTYAGTTGPGSLKLMAAYGLTTLGCCFLLLAFLGIDGKALPGWAVYLGRISYGLYVFHLLGLDIVLAILPHHTRFQAIVMPIKGAIALGITVLFASLSYRFFETPFLRIKKRHEVIESRPV